MTESSGVYGPQPPYNPSYAPTCPPSYSEAVGAASGVPHPTPVQYPGSPAMPTHMSTPPTAVYVVGPPQVASTVIPFAIGPKPSRVTCPKCHAEVVTMTKSTYQKYAHVACFALFLLGFCLCSCIPYLMKSFKTIHHYCPLCKAFIGDYRG